MTDLFEGWVHF